MCDLKLSTNVSLNVFHTWIHLNSILFIYLWCYTKDVKSLFRPCTNQEILPNIDKGNTKCKRYRETLCEYILMDDQSTLSVLISNDLTDSRLKFISKFSTIPFYDYIRTNRSWLHITHNTTDQLSAAIVKHLPESRTNRENTNDAGNYIYCFLPRYVVRRLSHTRTLQRWKQW